MQEKFNHIMNKNIFALSLLLFLYISAAAQKQNVYFIKDDGQYVNLRDSADYIRVVQEPDSGSKLFVIKEYYLSGKRKSVGLSNKIDPPQYEGTRLSYYKNGNKKEVANYKDGHLLDSVYKFYPNGKLYIHSIYSYQPIPGGETYIVKSVNDSTGKSLAAEGNGYCMLYDDDFKETTARGNIKDGRRDGIWTGEDKNQGTTYTETYVNGLLVSGESTDEKNFTVQYTKEFAQPEFKGGIKQLYRFLSNNVIYPKNCQDNNIEGVAFLKFIVEKDGSISHITLINYVHPDLAAEAIRVLKKSPLWTPGMNRGRNVKVSYNIPVSFSLH